jgi:class 3 adenylate cyclase/tetratricopeptide (TPR) repeat protein
VSRCPQCQHDNPGDAKFCLECGLRLALKCLTCGTELPSGAKFCKECGQAVAGPALSPPARFGSPDSYTPKHLAERILTSKAALEGERKQVTVLFADLKGSMELLADRDPEEARKILDPILEHMMEAVHRYEGTVNQVMGDGIMALFGAPVAYEDHAVRACYAALRMQESVARYGDRPQRGGGVPVQIRVGLNSGEVVVRSVGSDLRMDYTAVGQTTHLAARMEQLAPPGTIRLTADTLRLAEGFVQGRSLGACPVKGLEDSVELFELVGAMPPKTRFQVTATRGFTRFVGRQLEMETFSQALARAGAGHGEVVALVGEPGVGKSRLVWEVTHSQRTAGWRLLETGSVSYGKWMAYRPIIDLLRTYFQGNDRDDTRQIRDKLREKLLTLDPVLEDTIPAFLALLDVPVEDPEWEVLDPPRRRQRTLEACTRLVLRESQIQPLLLVVEDLQWIDTETQAFLDSVVESLPTTRLLLVVNYRPEYEQRWASKMYYCQLRVEPLAPETAEELLGALLGSDPSLEPLKPLLIERSLGNPFFLEESVRTLIEDDAIVGVRGAYRLAASPGAVQIPKTVQAILAARIDRLPPAEKRLLQTAAVIGKDVPFTLLRAITDGPAEDLRQDLSHLEKAEFLYETRLFPDLEYTFKHPLTHEVAYRSLLQDRRRALHAGIVEAIEQLYPHRLTEQFERLAHHASRGELWEKALQYLRRAGAKALARSAYREAAESFKQALVALSHLPASSDTIHRAIDVRIRLYWALFPVGEYDSLLSYLEAAESLAKTLGDQRPLGTVSALLASFSFAVAKHNRALEYGERALAIGAASEDLTLQLRANFFLGQAYHGLGEYSRARDSFTQNLDAPPADLMGTVYRILSCAWSAWSLAELGEFSDATARAEQALDSAEALGEHFDLVNALAAVGLVCLIKGDLQNAIPPLERCLALSQAARNQRTAIVAGAWVGHAYALSGRLGDALTLLERSVNQAQKGMEFGHSLSLGFLGQAYLQLRRIEPALEQARLALDLSRAQRERGHEAYATKLLGEIASYPESPDEKVAHSYYGQAITLAKELGMRPLVAHCHLGLGKLNRRTGDHGQARDHLATATTMYREMDMRFWLERAEREMRALA